MKKIVLATCILAIVSLTACKDASAPITDSPVNSNGYYASAPMSELEYKMYLASKIATATGQINTHMAKLINVSSGNCNVNDEIEDIDSAISILKNDKTDLKYMYPPDTYSDVRDRALEYWQDAIDKLDEASSALSEGISKDRATELSTDLKNVYTSIQSLNI